MARSRNTEPEQIALPPSPHKDFSSAPGKPATINLSTSEPSPLRPDYIFSGSPVSPVTPEILGHWPENTMDMLGLATPERVGFGVIERDSRAKKSGVSVVTRRLVMYSVLVVFIAMVLVSVQYTTWNRLVKPWRECASRVSCLLGGSYSWQGCSHCVKGVFCAGVQD